MTTESPKTFGEFVFAKRKEMGLTQIELAKRVKGHTKGQKLSFAAISRLERDEIKVTRETGERILDALDLSPSEKRQAQALLQEHVESETRVKVIYPKTAMELEKLMEAAGLRVASVAEELKVSRQAAQHWKQGLQEIPSEQFERLVKFFSKKQLSTESFERAYVYEVVTVGRVFDFLPPRRRKAAAEAMLEAIFQQ